MKKGWIVYGIVVIFSLFYALGMQVYAGWVVFILTLVFPIIEILVHWLALRGNLYVDVEISQKFYGGMEQKESPELKMEFWNDAYYFPMQDGAVVLDIENTFLGKRERLRQHFSIKADAKESLVLRDVFSCPGTYRIMVRKIHVYDALRLVPVLSETVEEQEFVILPECVGDLQEILYPGEVWEGESEYYSHVCAGNDCSELRNIREYQMGDKCNRIHWKQTHKMGTPMVKEFGFPLACTLGLFVELNCKNIGKFRECAMEQIQTAYVLGYQLIMQDIPFELVWYDEQSGQLMQQQVWREVDLPQAFTLLLHGRIYSAGPGLAEIYHKQGGKKRQEAVFFSSDRECGYEQIRVLLGTEHLQVKRCKKAVQKRGI